MAAPPAPPLMAMIWPSALKARSVTPGVASQPPSAVRPNDRPIDRPRKGRGARTPFEPASMAKVPVAAVDGVSHAGTTAGMADCVVKLLGAGWDDRRRRADRVQGG